MLTRKMIAPAALALAVSACAQAPTASTKGESVRALIAEQTHDPEASAKNGTATPEGTDPDRAAGAVKAMREGVTKPDGETRGVTLNIGTGANGGR